MKSKRLINLNLAKETISTFDTAAIKGGATQSNQQQTGCQTNCTATTQWE
ncbi:hypothetical protein C8N46_11197 [Kordia periserrulae]|uniref:Uncharacterized protein n=1 Tax=Kordia periserrulae TaxID=701523 RepID=A0A2T6BSG6_9FLAO|nr:hypothetical protein [Kordia periserrulae]PTX59028.1 hypothetical protein C8N46_11197 [Kordia periserrulae]